jgi:antitoxin component YwqK of YwqJK toxin-antitoxin module
MIKKTFLFLAISFSVTIVLHGQNLNLDEYDIFIGDTLINKTDFITNGKSLNSERTKRLTFKPIADGQKRFYYLNGQLSGQGEIKNKKENGLWTYWHDNGQKAREGSFDEGKRTGTHTYWYPNGKLRGVGNFKNDKYDGKWTMYNEDGTETIEQIYKDGELVKQK